MQYSRDPAPRAPGKPEPSPEDGAFTEFLAGLLTPERLARVDEVLALRTRFVTVVLEDLYQRHNASACLRNCECFGVQDVHVIEADRRFRPSTDVAVGAAHWLTIHRYRGPADSGDTETEGEPNPTRDCLRTLRQRGYRVAAMCVDGPCESLDDFPIDRPTALVFGSELNGLTDEARAAADVRLRIPIVGFTESFNVSVSVALALQTLTGRLRRSELPWQLTAAEKDELRRLWIRQSIGHRLPQIEREFHRRGK